jgi:hypothetical protein
MNATTISSSPVFKKAGVKETTVLLALAWLVPFVVHLVPWSGERPLGAYLLPMCWTTLVAVYFFGAWTGLVTALCAPAINLAITGLPALRGAGFASFELVIFVFAMSAFVRSWPRAAWLAPVAYVMAKLSTVGLQILLSVPGISAVSLQNSLTRALAGMAALGAIHAALVAFYPKSTEEKS